VIPGASGRLVPPGDPAALAADLRELLSNDAERERLADGARHRVEAEFSAARQAERHAAMYERVLARRQRS
jgi:glycosyltransferase involved in cell wall biosynthesis